MATPSLTFLLALIFFSITHAQKLPPHAAIHFPIRKDETTLQYYTTLEIGSPISRAIINALIDLGGQYVWFDCGAFQSSSYRPISCGSSKCKSAKSISCVGCNSTPRPGCTNNTCGVFGYNPVKNVLVSQGLGEDTMNVLATDGRSILLSHDTPHFQFSCSESFILEGLASKINGLAGLARTKTSLPGQISTSFKLPQKLALCLPSSTNNGPGDIFVGGGPYYMTPIVEDQSKWLTTTPLLINPVSTAPIYSDGDPSDEYFIQVNDIEVDDKTVPLNKSLLSISKEGVGGTKLSVTTPYTVLHSSIYKRLISHYVKAAASDGIKRVKSVAPFGACFSMSGIGETITGPAVPDIHLVLQGISARFTIYGANSMVTVKKKVMCLAFIDGGAEPRTSIVLGGHQLENYLLEFDLASSNLGFTTSLLNSNSSCSHSRLS